MAIGDIREGPKRGVNHSIDDNGFRTVTTSRVFTGVSDAPTTDSELDAITAIGTTGTVAGEFIRVGSSHPQNIWITVSSISASQNGTLLWEYTVNYKSPKFPGDQTDPQDPDFEPPQVSFSTNTTDEPIDEDTAGAAIATATGELFTGVTKSVSDLVATITKKFWLFDPSSFYLYIDKVNSDTFLGFPAGTARVTNIAANREFQDQTYYWTVTVQVSFRRPYRVEAAEAWYKRIRHEGYRCFSATGPMTGPSDTKPCQDGTLHDATTPMLLNEDGTQKTDGTDPEWLTFQVYESTAFSGMNLGV